MSKVLLAVGLFVLFPCCLHAQEQDARPFIPKPVFTECMPDYRCLDVENYKLVLEMRAEYTALHQVHTKFHPEMVLELKKAVQYLEAAEEATSNRADNAEMAYNEMFHKYEAMLIKQESESRFWSYATAVVMGVAVGSLVTYLVEFPR